MAAVIKSQYGTSNQAITITLASLATAAAQASTSVDNTTNLYLDATLSVKFKTNAAGVSATGFVNVFVYGTADSGTTWSGGVTGTDSAFTLNKDALIFLGSVPAIALATTYVGLFKLSRAFGFGSLPSNWGVVIDNESGAAFDATAGSHAIIYQGQLEQVV